MWLQLLLITNMLCPPYSFIQHEKAGKVLGIICNLVCYWCFSNVQNSHLSAAARSSKSCADETSAVKHVGRMFGGRGREHHVHLEVAAGQYGHPLLPLQDVDDAAGPAHLRCQRGRGRLGGPPSFGWVAYSNSRGHLDLVMAWSGS